VKTNRGPDDLQRLPHLQKQLILCAIDSLNVGGYLCYSTCSVLIEENEDVIQYALRKRDVKIVDTGLTFGVRGFVRHMAKAFDATMAQTRRYYPHTYNMDGFFVAKLQKISNATKASSTKREAVGGDGAGDIIDKTPISGSEDKVKDDFGGFDEEEDAAYIEKARRNAMRRRGLNPKARQLAAKAAKETGQ
jgi:ribosomal RNA methyltransferase Nop2